MAGGTPLQVSKKTFCAFSSNRRTIGYVQFEIQDGYLFKLKRLTRNFTARPPWTAALSNNSHADFSSSKAAGATLDRDAWVTTDDIMT
jgi:hypothetical protein